MKKKIAVIVCSVVLMLSLAISGTIAYLTDTAAADNTFTVGNIDIVLDEPNWDSDDGLDVLPGDTMPKDPVVTATEGDSYIRYKLDFVAEDGNPMTEERVNAILACICYDSTYAPATATLGTGIVDGTAYTTAQRDAFDDVNPAFVLDAANSTATVKYYTCGTVLTEGNKTVLFTNVVIPSDYTRTELGVLGDFTVVVTAQAIQSTGFADAAAAFAELAL